MSTFTARYFDGRSAVATDVTVEIHERPRATLRILAPGLDLETDLEATRWSDRLGGTRRFINLPDGASLETRNNEIADDIVARFGVGRRTRWIFVLERSWPYALAALFFTALAIWAGITYGVPAAANRIATQIPLDMEARMGEETMAALDAHLLEPTQLSRRQIARVTALYDSLPVDREGRLLEIRAAPELGANAFALPSGIMVVTDELVELAESDDELLAVMAHELGHIEHRHIMRSLIQNSMTALLVAVLIGDLSSIAGLSATVPTFLMEAKHSRDFELEADAYAAELLERSGKDPAVLGTILRRLTEEHGDDEGGSLWRYLSTHPATEERIKALEERG